MQQRPSTHLEFDWQVELDPQHCPTTPAISAGVLEDGVAVPIGMQRGEPPAQPATNIRRTASS
jgi:hypothetical protein